MKKTQTRYKTRDVDGILLFDKPRGMTSNFALQRVKRLYAADKAGHTGSLDPMATGLLPIFFGQATKLCVYLLEADKRYRAKVRLGIKTTSADADGEVIATSDSSAISKQVLLDLIPRFLGEIEQIPPMHSAIKIGGIPLYELAHQGMSIERQIRKVTIRSLSLLSLDDEHFEFEVTCSKGTYVRTLAEDWAAAAGQCAHLVELRRLQTGSFSDERMVKAEQVELAKDLPTLDSYLLPLSAALAGWDTLTVPHVDIISLRRGLFCGPYKHAPGQVVVLNEDGAASFIAEVDGNGRLASKRWIGPELALN